MHSREPTSPAVTRRNGSNRKNSDPYPRRSHTAPDAQILVGSRVIDLSIILADDEEDWYLLMRRAIAHAGIKNLVEHAKDGEAVVTLLKRRLKNEDIPLPLFLLLDLKMPRLDGFGTLKWIRSEPRLDGLPVIVLTSSENEEDVRNATAAGADGYLLKGSDNTPALTFIYERSKLVREGKMSRKTAFVGLPQASVA
jgi:CheY-like chemotaxis protein